MNNADNASMSKRDKKDIIVSSKLFAYFSRNSIYALLTIVMFIIFTLTMGLLKIMGLQLYGLPELIRGFENPSFISNNLTNAIISAIIIVIIYIVLIPFTPIIFKSSWKEIIHGIELFLGLPSHALQAKRPGLVTFFKSLIRGPMHFYRGIFCGSARSIAKHGNIELHRIYGRRKISILSCPSSLEVEESVLRQLISNPLILLRYPPPPTIIRTFPQTLLLVSVIVDAAVFILAGLAGVAFAYGFLITLLSLPLILYIVGFLVSYAAALGYLTFWRTVKLRDIDNEMPYITAFTGALLVSGLNIGKVFSYAQALRHLLQFRKISGFIFKLQRLTGKNLLQVMDHIAEVHPAESVRVFLGTLVTIEKIGGERFSAIAKLNEVFIERLRRRIKEFIDKSSLLMTLSIMLFVLVPMIAVIALFLFSNILGPSSFILLSIGVPLLGGIGMVIIITNVYVYEITENLSFRIMLPAAIVAAMLVVSIVFPVLVPQLWMSYVTNLIQNNTVFLYISKVTGIPLNGEYVLNYAVLINTFIAVIGLLILSYPVKKYYHIQRLIESFTELVRAIAEQAKINIRPSVAIRKFILFRAVTTKERLYSILAARLSYNIELRHLLDGVDKQIGFALPRGIYRLFELLHFMERIGLEPRSIERFADILVDVFDLRREVVRKTKSSALLGLSFVIVLVLLIAAVKVSVINGLEAFKDFSTIGRGTLYGMPVILKPLSPSQKLEALLLTYYATLLNGFILGYISGKIASNNVVVATLFASISLIVIGLIIFMLPLIEPYIPVPRI